MKPALKRREGAAMVESCIVIMLLCLILFGILQLSSLTAANDVVAYAASCGARSAAVGYNKDMVNRAIQVAAIPNLGPGSGIGVYAEQQKARDYLLKKDNAVLNYRYLNTLGYTPPDTGSDEVKITLTQNYPLVFPFARAFYGKDEVQLSSDEVRMMNHADLYLGN